MASEGQADQELKLDVDLMILDYLVHDAIKGVINERLAERNEESSESPEGSLDVVDSFLSLFKGNYGTDDVPNGLRVKVQMLTFSNLFFRRYKISEYQPSIQTLQRQRDENKARVQSWLGQHRDSTTGSDKTANPITSPSIAENRRDMLVHMGISPNSPTVPSLDSTVSLLDIVPELMTVCSMARPKEKPGFMELTTIFMNHAALEQILIYGREAREAVDETFAWSWMNETKSFHGEDDLRESTMEAILRASKTQTPSTEYRKLLSYYPLFNLEGSLLEMVKVSLDSLDTPILTQLEAGKLNGLTRSETKSLKERVGIL